MRLLSTYQDVLSGGKSQRPGLADALSRLRREAEVLVVVKFDSLSRSIRHFCEIYETHFRDGAIDDAAEQSSIAQFNTWAEAGIGASEMVSRLNAAGLKPRQGQCWTQHTIYKLRLRLSQIQQRAVNVRAHTDEDLKDRMLELRARGHTHAQVASTLNELGFFNTPEVTGDAHRASMGVAGAVLLQPAQGMETASVSAAAAAAGEAS